MTSFKSSSRVRAGWRIVGVVLTAAALAFGTITAWATASRTSVATETQRHGYPRTAHRVEADVALGSVTLTAGEPEQVQLDRELHWSHTKPTTTQGWTGDGTFRVTAACPNSFPPWINQVCSVEHAIRVPPDVAAEVTTTTADIEVRELGGPLRLSSSTGAITGSGLRSAHVDARLSVGDLHLSFAEPPERVTVAATAGTITIEVPRGESYRVPLDATAGDHKVDVVQDPAATRVIEVNTTSTDVHVRYA